MSYGLSLDQVRKVHHPDTVTRVWGSLTPCTDTGRYSLVRADFGAAAAQPLHFYADGARDVFVERGALVVRRLDQTGRAEMALLQQGMVLRLAPFEVHAFASVDGAEVYIFGPGGASDAIPVETAEQAQDVFRATDIGALSQTGEPTTDRREKYWGSIETICAGEVAGKRIAIAKGGQSSLEFHVQKHESYYIKSGLLKVGLRVGRAENHSLLLHPGDSYDIYPGVMHMRIALEETVIIEASTRDSDADSHLVEDGQRYQHIDTTATPAL